MGEINIIAWLDEQADLFDQQGLSDDFEFGCYLALAAKSLSVITIDNTIMLGALRAIALGSAPASEQAQRALDAVHDNDT